MSPYIHNLFHTDTFHTRAGTLLTISKPITHYYHPEFIVCIQAHSWCCTSYGFGQMYNNIVISSEQFHCPKTSSVLHIFIPLSPLLPTPTTTNLFISLYSFVFSRMSYSWNLTKHSFFSLDSFTQQYAFLFTPCFFHDLTIISFQF